MKDFSKPSKIGLMPVVGLVFSFVACQKNVSMVLTGASPSVTPSPEPSQSDSTSTPTVVGALTLGTFARIIGVTDPVARFAATDTSEDATQAAAFNSLALPGPALALVPSDGISLGTSAADIAIAFNRAPTPSKAYCDTVNSAMKFFKESSAPDLQLCILKNLAKTAKPIGSGKTQIWDSVMSKGSQTMKYRFKFKIDTVDDKLAGFESFTCFGTGTNLKQQGYVKQTYTSDKVSVLTRSQSEDHGGFKLKLTLNAAINSEGKMVGLKNINYAEAEDTRKVHGLVTQSDENIRYNGYEDVGRLTQYYSFAQLLNKNTDGAFAVTKLTYGDGAAFVRVTDSALSLDHLEGWDGGNLSLNASEERLEKVRDQGDNLLHPDGDSLDLEFPSTAAYDCSGTAHQTFTTSVETIASDCMKAYDIDQNGSEMCNDLGY